ncbi:MAG: DNA adenine methylase [Duncaniella sp.]|uniref:DNA adenine methylase n=1 Tax=Duncaniella sp. TaxID=2518496 RepID=UPI0023BEB85A|nr:DNA adenine methylase [Duncaniella sp.]MDE6091077.1 DNA adenine methylase [Duncaniella sp.]
MEYINISNRRYLGNKYKLLPFIHEVVMNECANVHTFFDVFAGTGAVASAFTNCHLIVNDLMRSNFISSLAWFSSQTFSNEKVIDLINYFNSFDASDQSNYVSENFSNTYFSENVCKKIGYIRETIESMFQSGAVNQKEWAIIITSLFYSMDRIAATCGHYDSFIQGADLPNDIILRMPILDYPLADNNICLNADANLIASDYECDIAYLDPPYNSRQYCDAYHLLENIAIWQKPKVFGIARKMDRSTMKSEYCRTSATKQLEYLVNHLNARYILLSYNNNGNKLQIRSNAKISDENIMRILSTRGDVRIFTKDYRPFSAGKGENVGNQERLFLCAVRR